jgi:hypothetical protein
MVEGMPFWVEAGICQMLACSAIAATGNNDRSTQTRGAKQKCLEGSNLVMGFVPREERFNKALREEIST